jgi:tetratricopeptide (TPR) repeat protein
LGYCHYWGRPTELPGPEFGSFAAECRTLRRALDGDVKIGDSIGEGEPIFSEEAICFNGHRDLGHETFLIRRVFDTQDQELGRFGLYWDFVKTNGKPYDQLVVAVLVSLKHYFPTSALSSDGGKEDWASGIALYERATGRQAPSFDVLIARDLPDDLEDPKDADAYYNRGLAYTNKGELDRAIADYDEVIRLNPKYAEAYNNRGVAYANKGELDRAIADYDEAIRLDPINAVTYHNRGVAYANKGELDRAIADYDEAIRLDLDPPREAAIYYARGVAYASKGELDRAIGDYDDAIRLDPKNAGAYYNRGVAYTNKGELDRAIADYDEVIRLNPKIAAAYTNRGVAYAGKGDYARAIADYDQALTFNLDDRSLTEVRQKRNRAADERTARIVPGKSR